MHAPYDAHDIRRLAPHRHEVEHDGRARARVDRRLEDQRILAIGAPRAHDVAHDEGPAAVLGRPHEARETGIGIEARPAEPDDRARVIDQRGSLPVADHREIVDPAHVADAG